MILIEKVPILSEKAAAIFSSLAIISSAFSISLAHISIGLALFSWLILFLAEKVLSKRGQQTLSEKREVQKVKPPTAPAPQAGSFYKSFIRIFASFSARSFTSFFTSFFASSFIRSFFRSFFSSLAKLPASFLSGLALFSLLLVNAIFQLLQGGIVTPSRIFSGQAETSGLLFLIFGLLIWKLSEKRENRHLFYRSLSILFILLILSGAVAAFFRIRLGLLIINLFTEVKSSNFFQYPLTAIGGIDIYKTRGFMSTSLTYGGMLALFFPALLAVTLRNIQKKKSLYSILSLVMLPIFFFSFWASGTRSALVGIIFAFPFVFYQLKQQFFNNFSISALFISKKQLYRLAVICLLTATGLTTVLLLYRQEWQKIIQPFLRYSTYSRQLIWSANGDIIADHPLSGIGVGNYSKSFISWGDQFISQNPDLWNFVRNQSSGHAHNDLLQIATVGGIPAALLFLIMVFYSTRPLFQKRGYDWLSPYLFCGSLIFLMEGVAECYFQDSEVVALFWILQGLACPPHRDR